MSRRTGEDSFVTATTKDDGAGLDGAHVRVAIVGSGFSGLGMAIRLKQRGMQDFVVLERGDDVGGTWHDNTYPGCACDVPAHLYSFSFALNPGWSHIYARQPEIWDYLRACAQHYGVLPHIHFKCVVLDVAWDEDERLWRVATPDGELTAELLVLGNGPLSEPALPALPGLERFEGTVFHSAQWNGEHDLSGERVAVIGTGASSVQLVPHIQPLVDQLVLFQRTPPWILPRRDHAISPGRQAFYRALPLAQRLVRDAIYWQHEIAVLGFVYRPRLMQRVEGLAQRYLASQIADPALREKLTPSYRMGCKRILLSDDFYPALTEPNVELVTESVREVRARSIVAGDGIERNVDTIILATGFRATDMPLAAHVRGRGGRTLAEAWRDGPEAYLGTTVAGFPNLFMLIGPNTGLGHTSMVYMIESQLRYVQDCLRVMDRWGLRAVEVRAEAQASFNEELQRRMRGSVWVSGCKSWYLDAGGRNSTLWPGFTWTFRRRTRRFDTRSYDLLPREDIQDTRRSEWEMRGRHGEEDAGESPGDGTAGAVPRRSIRARRAGRALSARASQ
jgi:cation diffusion facilitator CzcD-associated flavoprotein CzcO